MKAWELAEEWRRIFALDTTAFPAATIHLRTGQDSAEAKKPMIVFEVTTTPLDGRGRVLSYLLAIIVESNPHDTADSAHAAWVSTVQRKLIGAGAGGTAAAKAALTAAFVTGGKFTLRNYDLPPEAADPDVDAHRFRSAVRVAGVALVTGNV